MNYGRVEERSSSRNRSPSTARRDATSAILTDILSRSDRAPTSRTADARPGWDADLDVGAHLTPLTAPWGQAADWAPPDTDFPLCRPLKPESGYAAHLKGAIDAVTWLPKSWQGRTHVGGARGGLRMADVFLSYASEDRVTATLLAQALESAGLRVWYDRRLQGGSLFATEIERELHVAGCVVVLWSAASVTSEWVLDEAAHARDRNRLVPVAVAHITPPIGFRQRHVLDLSAWSGDPGHAGFVELIASVKRLLAWTESRAPDVDGSH